MTRIEQLKQELNTIRNKKSTDTTVPMLVRAEERLRMASVNYTKARLEMLIRVEKAKQA